MERVLGKNNTLIAFAGIISLYVIFSLLTPVDPEVAARYDLSESGVRLLSFSVLVPICALWGVAYYGFSQLRSYSKKLGRSSDAAGFEQITKGIMWLIFSLPVRTAVSAIFNYAMQYHDNLEIARTISMNIVSVVFSLLAFIAISRGAESLIKILKKQHFFNQHIWVVFAVILNSAFTYLIVSRSEDSSQRYYLPDGIFIAFVAIPLVYSWYRGAQGAYILGQYQKKVRGKIYKTSLNHLARGINAAILFSIAMQVITAMSGRINRLDLQPVLLILYSLLLLLAISFLYIAFGARRLKKLEEA